MSPLETLIAALEQGGFAPKRVGAGRYEARCPAHDDRNPSLTFGAGSAKPVVLKCQAGCSYAEVLAALGIEARDLEESSPSRNGKPEIVAVYQYEDADGSPLFEVVRHPGKRFVQRRPDGNGGYIWDTRGVVKDIYRRPAVNAAVRSGEPVYIVEGERDVEAVEKAGAVATTNPGGAGKWRREYGRGLDGAKVTIIADKDDPGRKHARAIAEALSGVAASVKLVEAPAPHKDVSDLLAAGGSLDDLGALVGAERGPAELTGLTIPPEWLEQAGIDENQLAGVKGPKDLLKLLTGGKSSTATAIVEAVKEAGAVLFHDSAARAFATFETDGHRETWPVLSKQFKLFCRHAYYRRGDDDEPGAAPNGTAVGDAVAQLEAEAIFDGQEIDVHLRVARVDGCIYIDLGDARWRCVRIDRDGWTVLEEHPVRFRRSGGMGALPDPARGGSIEDLRPLLNLGAEDDDAWRLIVAYLLGATLEGLPMPVLVLHGEQGSAKSSATRVIRSLIDPSSVPLRSAPRKIDDLLVSATAGWISAYDNVSRLEPWLSDAICRLSTGGGLGKRELYTDGDEYLLDAQRPIILNGIAEIATRGDLLDRALMVELPVIPDAARVDEESFWQRFEQAQPKIFGALLDAAASALDRLPSVKLAQAPRMADFARLIVAAEPGLGWEPGSFLMAYRRSRGDIHETAIESSIVGPLIRTIAEAGFDDTATVLLQHVNDLATDADRRSKDWPANVEALTARVKRLAPDLRRLGYTVEHGRRTVNGRTRRIWTLGARG